MDYYAHPLFEKLMKDEENNICNDCRIGHPNWASVNNGVFLCLNCAGIHRGFGVLVSNIRSLTMDNWDENQINFLLKGGNLRFKAFMKEYNVPSNAGPDFKYLISATNYYRKLLRAEITHETLPEKPDSISGLELLDLGNNYYTNIDNSAPITNQAVIKNEFNPVKKQGFFGKIGGFLGNVKESVSEKIKEAKLGEKLKETSEKALVVAKKTGNFVVKKGKEAYTSTFVQNIANKTEEGLNTIVNKAKQIFRNDEEGHKKSLNSSNYHSLDNDHSLLNQNENSNFSVNYISENKNISTNQSNLNQN